MKKRVCYLWLLLVATALACSAASTVEEDTATRVATEVWFPTLTAIFVDMTATVQSANATPEATVIPDDCDYVNPLNGECMVNLDWPVLPLFPTFEPYAFPTEIPFTVPDPIMLVRNTSGGYKMMMDNPGEEIAALTLGFFVPCS